LLALSLNHVGSGVDLPSGLGGQVRGPKGQEQGWGSWEGAVNPLPTSYGIRGAL